MSEVSSDSIFHSSLDHEYFIEDSGQRSDPSERNKKFIKAKNVCKAKCHEKQSMLWDDNNNKR